MRLSLALVLQLAAICPVSATLTFGPEVDTSLLRITQFASGLTMPQSMQSLSDGSILAQQSPGSTNGALVLLRDTNNDGVADFQSTLFTSAGNGPLTQLVTAGEFFIQGSLGDHSLSILRAGPSPSDPIVEAGILQFTYTPGWWHDTAGLAVRPTAQPGVYDLIFNVGSQFDNITSIDPVILNGLGLVNQTLVADSLYMLRLDLTGASPKASNVQQVAHGIRNVFGMQFDSKGNLWFTDNAMDGVPFPPQAEELNMISAADLGNVVKEFGFPTCFPNYFTGVHAVPGCTEPIVSFLPYNGHYSQGSTQIAFAPSGLPAPFNNGIFIGFAGNGSERNPVIYYDFTTGKYIHFIEGGSLGRPTGLFATNKSLFISDLNTGEILEISSATPEPTSFGLATLGLAAAYTLRRLLKTSEPVGR